MVLGGLIVVLLLGLVGCGSDSDGSGNVLGGGKQTADLVIRDTFPFYDPADLTMPLNKEVTFTVLNDGTKVHNVTIPGFTIDMDVDPGQRITVKLPAISAPPRDGFYTLYCKYHQADGEATRIKIAK
jgi:plastocyanin